MITPNENIGAEGRTTEGRTLPTREVEMFRTTVDKPFARVSWGAIFGGALTALSTLMILSLLGLGVGLSTLSPATGDNPSGTAIGIGAVLWWIISSMVSLFVGGYVAGRLAGNFNGFLHGLVTWATVSIITVMFLGSAMGRIFSGATGLAQFAASSAPALAPELTAPLKGGAAEALSRAQGTATDPAARAQAEQAARQAGEQAARGGAMGSFGAAVALLLGAAAACFGGVTGKKRFLDVVPERKEFLSTSRM